MKKFVVATVLLGFSSLANASEISLTISSSHGLQIPWVAPLNEVIVAKTNDRLAELNSEYSVRWTESYGGALYGFTDTLSAVAEGLTDAGWIGSFWEESSLPYSNLTFFTPFTTDDSRIQMDSFNRMYQEIPALREEWEQNNVVFLGATGTDTYHLYTNFPVDAIEDLRGRRILAPGSAAQWISAVGAVPVNGALPTYYNQLGTGVADGVIVIVTGAHPLKLHQVAPYVTLVDTGANMVGGFAVNKDVWDTLPEDVKKVLSELGLEYSTHNAKILEERYEAFLAELRADPSVTVSTLPAEERQKWVDALPDLAAQWGAELPEAKSVLDSYMQSVRDAGVTPARDWSLE